MAAAPIGGARIVGLDAWRALLMLGGILVHASGGLPMTPLFVVIADASEAFRMGVFFAISGFLTALALARGEPTPWLRRRLRELGVPALFGVALLSPLIWWLDTTGPRPSIDPPMPFEWHHLWFLFGLIGYSIAAVRLHAADRRWALTAWLDRVAERASGRLVVLTVAASSALLFALAVPLLVQLPSAWTRGFGHVQMIAGYLPMFVFGFALARSERLRARVTAASGFSWAVIALTAAAYATTHAIGGAAALAEHVRFLAAALCPPAVLALVLRSALAMRRVNPVLGRMADASYTIYVVHVPIGIAINTRLGVGVEPHVAYLLTAVAAVAAGWAIHLLLVRQVPLAALLLNGRRSREHRTTREASGTAAIA